MAPMEMLLLLAVVALVVAYGRLAERVAALQRDVDRLETASWPEPSEPREAQWPAVAAPAPPPPAAEPLESPEPSPRPSREWVGGGEERAEPVSAPARGESVGGFFERWV